MSERKSLKELTQNREKPRDEIKSGENLDLTTRTGLLLSIRPATIADEALLTEFFLFVTPQDIRFRFLSGLKSIDHDRLVAMLRTDQDLSRSFLAFDKATGTIVAIATLVAEKSGNRAEVAISVRSNYKHRGIGWSLLKYVSQIAKARGIKTLESMESRESHEAIELEREMGFTACTNPDDPSLIILSMNLA